MTLETEDYATRDLMSQGKIRRASNNWRALHTDFINNNERDGYHVTFVNGADNPQNTLENQKVQRMKELEAKVQDDTISLRQIRELLRLRL